MGYRQNVLTEKGRISFGDHFCHWCMKDVAVVRFLDVDGGGVGSQFYM